MIPPETIEQIRQAVDIVQVIGEYLKLKKRGNRYVALCPFHTEKTPSFSISQDKQLYYCFGCGRGGTVFNFLMEHEGMSFAEAVRYLAEKANIPIREDRASDTRREQSERITYANQVALDYFRRQLFSPRYSDILNKYLIAKRGMDKTTIETFALGLAGEEWDGLIKYAASKDLKPDELAACGLAAYSERTRSYYDRFRQRLIIPIFNLSQKPIAFGGRTLKKGESVKYINSPETALYIKGNVLYGLNFTKDEIKQVSSAIVVEGYFDLLSLWQVGVKNVVASSGTAFTAQQARLLARFAEEVYLFFDADSAGRTAAIRSVDVLYDAGLEVKVMTAPSGEDPDSLARTYGKFKIEELRETAMGFIPFRTHDFEIRSAGIIGKEKLVKEFSALGNKIADPTRRSLFLAEAANVLDVDISLLQRAPAAQDGRDSEVRVSASDNKHNPIEVNFLSLLFHNPGNIDEVLEEVSPEDFDSRELSRLYSAMAQQYISTGELHAGRLIDTARDNEFVKLITYVASQEWDREKVDRIMVEQYLLMKEKRRKALRAKLRTQLEQATSEGDSKTAERISEELKRLGLWVDKEADHRKHRPR